MAHRPGSTEFAAALLAARQEAGNPSYGALARLAYSKFGDAAPREATIRHYHIGRVTPERAELALVAMLANAYGVGLDSLSPVLGERLERERREIDLASRCIARSSLAA